MDGARFWKTQYLPHREEYIKSYYTHAEPEGSVVGTY